MIFFRIMVVVLLGSLWLSLTGCKTNCGSDVIRPDLPPDNVVKEKKGESNGLSDKASTPPVQTPAKLLLREEKRNVIHANLDADIVVFDIFNMYCSVCQKKAVKTQAFYDLLKKKKLEQKILFIGIAIQNTNFEAAMFMKKYKINFTVYSDRNSKYYNILSAKQWPWFIIMKRIDDGVFKIVFRGLALEGTPEEFLKKVLEIRKPVDKLEEE